MRVLVVEDDKKISGLLELTFKNDKYDVSVADSMECALQACADTDFDLIVLDVALKGNGTGYDICEELRAEGIDTPIMFLTARSDVLDKVKGFELGADDYLTKPFEIDELLVRARNLIRRYNGKKTDLVKVGNISINTASHEVHVKQKKINLTPNEYIILHFLALRSGKAVSRGELIDQVQGVSDQIYLTNVIDVHITNIRKKLGVESSHLTTIKNVGYLLQ